MSKKKAIIGHAAILAIYAKQQKELKQKIKDLRQTLMDDLLSLAPQSVHEVIQEDSILSCLAQYGEGNSKFTDKAAQNFDFKDRKTLFDQLKELQKAWRGIIKIRFITTERNRFEIVFKLVI